ncbi:MAG: EamA family transporter [Armatimonadota bacterium]
MRSIVVALFLVIAIALGAFGQVALKQGMSKISLSSGAGMAVGVVRAIFTPYVFLGFLLYAISSCFWLVVISKWNLSYAYPMIAIGYIGVVFLSRIFFKEHVTPMQWVGIVLMCGGLAIVTRFGASTGAMH